MTCLGKSLNLVIFCIFINFFPVSSQFIDEKCGEDFGDCVPGKTSCKKCGQGFSGTMKAECDSGKRWIPVQETCVSRDMQRLLQVLSSRPTLPYVLVNYESESLVNTGLSVVDLTHPSEDDCTPFSISCAANMVKMQETTAGNIASIVTILNLLRNSSDNSTKNKMKYYGEIANHILNKSAVNNWSFIPNSIGNSSALLQYVNEFASTVDDSSISVTEDFVHVKGFKVNQQIKNIDFNFSVWLNGTEFTGSVSMLKEDLKKLPINSPAVAIAYTTIGEILSNQLQNRSLNGFVISVALNTSSSKLSLTFQKKTKSNANAKCVGWDREEKNWKSGPCSMDKESYDMATCRCNHSKRFTSFSILMSHQTVETAALNYISFVGIGISICSLLVCLTIEGLLWRHITKTEISYMRHLSIVNIAISLLIADAWFIVGAVLYQKDTEESDACIAATFFIHLFYLSLFFWMLVLALLISYRVLMVFHNMRKSSLIYLAFAIGYGCPLIISVITLVATITQPNKPYVRKDGCWLNWTESKALLAFVIPAFLIITLNFIIVLAVIVVLVRQMVGENPRTNERSIIVQVIRCVAILTPLLGLTWGFGIATIIENSSLAFHYIFTVLNAFQGFFILVFGTLIDKQVREALTTALTSPKLITFLTKNTSNGPVSS
ncbi:adhesion G protein-coupled receptor F4 [Microcaecilia unicolor]|uniref:Adhesion G protein-coupled receptor F4 n=1 Tax=Microcaecilia unicolor TaxID=1415580 RepID=A0A6P7XNE9_9AMPH|nr:adhesion G protein-coupled receptor F4 [Microcaecilia unicolor]